MMFSLSTVLRDHPTLDGEIEQDGQGAAASRGTRARKRIVKTSAATTTTTANTVPTRFCANARSEAS
jgi:hypothetical protein